MPWRNGGGTTAEIARAPVDSTVVDFAWRVSLARIDAPGAFSTFPGVDRVLMPIGEAPVVLTIAGEEYDVAPGAQVSFPGELAVSADLPAGPARCLNLMTRRGGPRADLSVISGPGDLCVVGGETLLIVGTSDGVTVHTDGADPLTLQALDAVCIRRPGRLSVGGDGTAVGITIRD